MSAEQIQQQPEQIIVDVNQDTPVDSQSLDQDQQQQQDEQIIASIADGGRELSKTILYVGNIHRSVSDESLQELFSSLGSTIKSLKVLQDKNKPGFNYAFVEYEDADAAENALNSLNNTVIAENQLKITKAYQTQQIKNIDTFNLFIGDLSLEVNDELLNSSFQKFPSLVQANVMWDMKSGRSRGYGFVCFEDKKDAEDALQTMNGYLLGDRQIRLNWASHRDNRRNNNNNNNNGYNNNYNNNHYNSNMNNFNNFNNNNSYNNYNNNNNGNANINNLNNMMNGISSNNGDNLVNGINNDAMNMMNMNMMNINNSSNNSSNVSNPANNMLINNMNNINANNNINSINNNKVRNNMMSMGSSNDMMNNQQNNGNMTNRPPLMGPPSYEMVLRQAPNWLSAVYLGNLADYTTQNDLIPLLQNFGYIVNFKLLSDKGCAFVTYDTHERAALAIVQLSGFTINGRPLKCGWGKSNKVVSNTNNNNNNNRNIPNGMRN